MSDSRNSEPKPQRPANRPIEPDDDEPRPMFSTNLIPLLLLGAVVLSLVFVYHSNQPGTEVEFMYLWKQVEEDNVEKVVFNGELVTGRFKQLPPPPTTNAKMTLDFFTIMPMKDDFEFRRLLIDHKTAIRGKSQELSLAMQSFLYVFPIIVFVAFFWWMIRRGGDPMSSGMLGSFIRSPAKRVRANDHTTTFADVAAMEQAKAELSEVVEFLKNPAKFQKLGAQIPKGVLLMGSPGTGKTLLARATAGEAGVPFFTINGAEFIQMFVGVGASRVRDMFRTAKESAPCILFIDEIDAVGRVRGAGLGGGHDEREQTLNQILGEMDGFTPTEAVIVVAATNRPDVLDPALLRPGRFDRHVTVDRPTRLGRKQILEVHCRHVPLDDDVNLERFANVTIGFSGAELKNLVNEAALAAARAEHEKVTNDDFNLAFDKVLMGAKREEILGPHEKKMTAYHEAGHALVSWLEGDLDPVHKVTIIPRGRSLGVTHFEANEDRLSEGERRLHHTLVMALGGRAAEKLVFGEYTSGAASDLRRATDIARAMISRFGMSDSIGPVSFREVEEHPFLGKEFHEQREHSEETAREIDTEIQRFLVDADRRALRMMTEHRDKLEALALALIEQETLDPDQIEAVIGPAVPRTYVRKTERD